MKKHANASGNPASGADGAAATAVAFEPDLETGSNNGLIEHEDIARLAYSYWEARGCPLGSSEEDWFRAEIELLRQSSASAK